MLGYSHRKKGGNMNNLRVPDSMSLDHAAAPVRRRVSAAEYYANQRAYWATYRGPNRNKGKDSK